MNEKVQRILSEATLRERNERLRRMNVFLSWALLVAVIWIAVLAVWGAP